MITENGLKQLMKDGIDIDTIKAKAKEVLEYKNKQSFYNELKDEYDSLDLDVTYEEYKNETKQILDGHITKVDGDGNEYQEEQFKDVLVRPYVSVEVTDNMIENKLIDLGYDYRAKRKNEYPPIEEQLDMIYKNQDEWRSCIEAIKNKYPKPIEG